ncbi:hypothetical protein Tco_1382781 [Tanacetum coccineum]
MKCGVSSWHGSRVDGRSYLLSGAINGSEANRIISDFKSDADLRRLVSFDVFRKARGMERLQELQVETLKFAAMPFGLTNAPAVFMELMSREAYESHVKMIVETLKEEKMYMKFSNNVEAEQRGSYLDVEGIKWVMSQSWHCRKEQMVL